MRLVEAAMLFKEPAYSYSVVSTGTGTLLAAGDLDGANGGYYCGLTNYDDGWAAADLRGELEKGIETTADQEGRVHSSFEAGRAWWLLRQYSRTDVWFAGCG